MIDSCGCNGAIVGDTEADPHAKIAIRDGDGRMCGWTTLKQQKGCWHPWLRPKMAKKGKESRLHLVLGSFGGLGG